MREPLEINFIGTPRSPTSLAHVTRELILALDARGHDVSVINGRGFLHDKDFHLPPHLIDLLDKPRNTRYDIAFDYPPNTHGRRPPKNWKRHSSNQGKHHEIRQN